MGNAAPVGHKDEQKQEKLAIKSEVVDAQFRPSVSKIFKSVDDVDASLPDTDNSDLKPIFNSSMVNSGHVGGLPKLKPSNVVSNPSVVLSPRQERDCEK